MVEYVIKIILFWNSSGIMSHDIQKLITCFSRKFKISTEWSVAFVLSVKADDSTTTTSHTVTLCTCIHVLALVRTDHHSTFPTPIKKSLSVHSELSTYLWLANCNHTLWLAQIMWLSQRNWLQVKEEVLHAMGKPPTWAVCCFTFQSD